MTYINQDNFDWSVTQKELVIFIPNFKRKHLIIPTLMRWKTSIPQDKWIILVVNDGIHENLSDLANYNVVYFTFERNPGERNGCMIRNYVIKRVQSRLLMSKDPEVILHGEDCLVNVMKIEGQVYRASRAIELMEPDTPKILRNNDLDISTLSHKREYPVKEECHEGFHFCYTATTNLLKHLRGYDEDYVRGYGYEDVDMLHRLRKQTNIKLDDKVWAMHIWHPRRAKFLKTVADNGQIYQDKIESFNSGILIANPNTEWGNG